MQLHYLLIVVVVSDVSDVSHVIHCRCNICCKLTIPLIPTLKLHSNGLLHSNTVIGTLAVDGWAVTFGTARRGLGGLWPRSVPSSLYQM